MSDPAKDLLDKLEDIPVAVWTTERPKVAGWYWWRDKAFVLSGTLRVVELSIKDLSEPWGDTCEWSSLPLQPPQEGGANVLNEQVKFSSLLRRYVELLIALENIDLVQHMDSSTFTQEEIDYVSQISRKNR